MPWIEDIEKATPEEREEMTQQPTGGAAAWAIGAVGFWVVAALVVYLLAQFL